METPVAVVQDKDSPCKEDLELNTAMQGDEKGGVKESAVACGGIVLVDCCGLLK